MCEDVEYKYTLDAYTGVLLGSGHSASIILTFETLRAGGEFFTTVFPSADDIKVKILDVCRSRLPIVDFNARKAAIEARIEATISGIIEEAGAADMSDGDWADYYLKRAR